MPRLLAVSVQALGFLGLKEHSQSNEVRRHRDNSADLHKYPHNLGEVKKNVD
jgi:hypothetical protein